jgi:16S rRNA (guanine966-N2)-methyltransferase
MKAKARAGAGVRNEVRIIAGRWRGRRIQFPDADGLRPTPDRVRETLFNWLQGVIPESRCLDVFAGSGAMGFEAASRGASSVTLIEQDSRTCRQLRLTAETLQARNVSVECADALTWLARARGQPFDVVFLDPPFARNLLAQVCALLHDQQLLAPGAYIYMEAPADQDLGFLPASWVVTRSKRAGQVGYHLARLQAPVAP